MYIYIERGEKGGGNNTEKKEKACIPAHAWCSEGIWRAQCASHAGKGGGKLEGDQERVCIPARAWCSEGAGCAQHPWTAPCPR